MAEKKTSLQYDTVFYTTSDFPDDIPSLQAESLHLGIRRSLILRKLNSLSSTTRALPTEVLSMIFMHTYPPPSFSPRINLKSHEAVDADATDKFPDPKRKEIVPKSVILGAVCSHWTGCMGHTGALVCPGPPSIRYYSQYYGSSSSFGTLRIQYHGSGA
jgi:hypothetical protein